MRRQSPAAVVSPHPAVVEPLCGERAMASSSPSPASNMTYAQALTDARSLIVQQSTRIKADAAKIKQQADEIAQWKSLADDMAAELERLKGIEPKLAEAQAA